MTYEAKYIFILGKYKPLENRGAFCYDLSEFLEENGKGGTKPHSMYSNWFSGLMGSIPESKIDKIYEFTEGYRENPIYAMGGKAPDIDDGLLDAGDHLEGERQIGTIEAK